MRVAVDVIIRKEGKILLIKRAARKPPAYVGHWAIVGGGVDEDETLEQAMVRETKEETGLDVKIGGLIMVADRVDWDPRERAVAVVHEAKVVGGELRAGDDAADAKWFTLDEAMGLDLAFDHNDILKYYATVKESGG